jgi:hypothetical protein
MTPRTSARLRRALDAEAAELDRERARLLARRDELTTELERIQGSVVELDERRALLERLAAPRPAAQWEPGTPVPGAPAPSGQPGAGAAAPAPTGAARRPRRGILRGTAVREEAARLLAGTSRAGEGIHYVEWLGLLEEAGWAVDGKDPRAVFLTQVSRAPMIRRTTVPGVYALDRGAPSRIRRTLDSLEDELVRLTARRGEGPDVRQRRRELTLAIGRAERALDECRRVLGPLERQPAPPRLAVAG